MGSELEGSTSAQLSRSWAADLLRGLVALGVVVWHYLCRAPMLYPQLGVLTKWADWMQHCLLLFFIISGYFIFDSVRASGTTQFLANRAIRLYPAYWLAVILTFTVVAIFGLPGRETSFKYAVFNLTMLEGYYQIPYVDGVYWTLTVELAFYAIIALLARTGALSDNRLFITLFAWLAAAAAVRGAGVVFSGIPMMTVYVRTAYEMPLFLIGIALNMGRRTGRWALPTAVIVAAIAVRAPGDLSVITPMVITTFVMLIAVYARLPTRTHRFADYLSEISYPLYLTHNNIGLIIILALASQGVPLLGAAAITLAIVIPMATFIAYAIDIPTRRRLRARVNERFPQRR
jgi:peptidoglycan/LPS O-acetylase OafA/YrhL